MTTTNKSFNLSTLKYFHLEFKLETLVNRRCHFKSAKFDKSFCNLTFCNFDAQDEFQMSYKTCFMETEIFEFFRLHQMFLFLFLTIFTPFFETKCVWNNNKY